MRSLLGALSGRREVSQPQNVMDPWPDFPTSTSTAGVSVNATTEMQLSAVWACRTLIADAIATLPTDVYRAVGEGREEVTAPRWITDPNPESDAVDFDTQRILSLVGRGNCFALLVREGGYQAPAPITERWVVDPSRITYSRGRMQELVWAIDGKRLRPGDLQHIAGYRLPGQVLGMSMLTYGAQAMGIGLAAEQYGAKFLENGANQSGVLTVPAMPEDATDDVVAQLRKGFMAATSGVENMGKPAVLTGGTTWTATSVTPEDSQLLETRQFQVADIARFHRVPPWMIGDVERSTSWGTGIEQQGIGFVTYTLSPWINRLERSDSALLAKPRFMKKNVNGLLRGDTKARSDWYDKGLSGGWLTVAEIRAWEELPPLPDASPEEQAA